ncbi:hypothetical protein [Clostridium chrysemydis]|uniref:hypothetical protein n=1 Tax=Clostridium chrysemydis TaxID=2665504 RepID=UPI00188334B5|nr:hypothetical protein [Clostridium chrysemydis]
MRVRFENSLDDYNKAQSFFREKIGIIIYLPSIVFWIATIYQGIITYGEYKNNNIGGAENSLEVTLAMGFIALIFTLIFNKISISKIFEFNLKRQLRSNYDMLLKEKVLELNENNISLKFINEKEVIIKYIDIKDVFENEDSLYITLNSRLEEGISGVIIPSMHFKNQLEKNEFINIINNKRSLA